MSALASDWLTHFQLLPKNGWRDLLQTCHKCSLWDTNYALLLFKRTEIHCSRSCFWLVAIQEVDNLKNGWRDLLQTCHKCSLWGPDQVLLLFKPIWNPIWPPWPLIGWHIVNFFSRMSEGIYSRLASNVPYEIQTMCCYSLNGLKSIVAAVASGWLPYK